MKKTNYYYSNKIKFNQLTSNQIEFRNYWKNLKNG